jgi:hypothetical protein
VTLPPSEASADTDIRPLNDREFELFRKLILRESGIHLSDAKWVLVVSRVNTRISAGTTLSFSSLAPHIGDLARALPMRNCWSAGRSKRWLRARGGLG